MESVARDAGPADSAPARTWREWLDAPALALLATLAVYALLYLVPWLSRDALTTFVDFYALTPLLAIAVYACSRGIARPAPRLERRFWGLLAAAYLAWLAATLFWLFAGRPGTLVDATIDFGYLIYYLCLLWALDQNPHAGPGRPARFVETWYAPIGTAVFSLALLVYFVVLPLQINEAAYSSWLPSYLLYLTLDVMLAGRLAYLAVRGNDRRWRLIYRALLLAVAATTITDFIEYLGYATVWTVTSPGPIDLLYYAPFVAIVAAARIRDLEPPGDGRTGAPEETEEPQAQIAQVPGVLIAYGFAIPAFHVAGYLTGLLDAATQPVRAITVLVSMAVIFTLVIRERIVLERANRELHEAVARTTARLQQGQKMEALGRLAGGVAHDFNNLLLIMRGYAEMLRESLPAGHPSTEFAREIETAADRATGLTRQLLAFSRRQILQPVALDLNDIVRRMESMLRRLVGDRLSLVLRLAGQPVPARADPSQVEQVLLNLVVNARDATPDGGTIEISTALVNARAEEPAALGHRYALLAVRDTGAGIARDVLPRIFEPFFTTKQPGQGTGLGLSMVQGIVDQSGGFVEVDTALHHGSEFRVFLPHTTEPLAAGPPGPAADVEADGSRATVLVVEDEVPVRKLVVRGLESAGYKVLEAETAPDAVEIARGAASVIDLVVTDVIMPVMSGPQVAREIERCRPAARVLYISGYTGTALIDRGIRPGRDRVLQKPFSAETLVQTVRAALE